jgi:hypothetical protein
MLFIVSQIILEAKVQPNLGPNQINISNNPLDEYFEMYLLPSISTAMF